MRIPSKGFECRREWERNCSLWVIAEGLGGCLKQRRGGRWETRLLNNVMARVGKG